MNVLMLLKPKSEVAYLFDTYTFRQGLEKMRIHGYTAIPVISKDGLYSGTVSEGDFLWHIINKSIDNCSMKKCEDYYIREIIRSEWNPAVTVGVSMDELLERAMNQNFIPVTDDRGYFIGIVTRKDIIAHCCEREADLCTVSAVSDAE